MKSASSTATTASSSTSSKATSTASSSTSKDDPDFFFGGPQMTPYGYGMGSYGVAAAAPPSFLYEDAYASPYNDFPRGAMGFAPAAPFAGYAGAAAAFEVPAFDAFTPYAGYGFNDFGFDAFGVDPMVGYGFDAYTPFAGYAEPFGFDDFYGFAGFEEPGLAYDPLADYEFPLVGAPTSGYDFYGAFPYAREEPFAAGAFMGGYDAFDYGFGGFGAFEAPLAFPAVPEVPELPIMYDTYAPFAAEQAALADAYAWDTMGYEVAVDPRYPEADVYGYGAWSSPMVEPFLDIPDITWNTD
jgi:hypothetical protein